MKIEKPGQDYGDRVQLDSANPVDDARSRSNAPVRQRAGARDEATVSDRARLLSLARAELDRTAAQPSERVSKLHDQVAAGQYQVPYGALAAKLYGQFQGPTPAV